MKKFLVTLVVLLLLAGGFVLALPQLLPYADFEGIAKKKVLEATGRELAFTDLRFSVFPDIGLRLKNVRLGNAAWAKEKDMLAAGELDVRLSLKALINRKVEVKRFNLKAPVIHLEKSADGRANWVFDAVKKAEKAESAGGAGGASALDLKLGEFRIEDGTLTYFDAATKSAQSVENIKVDVSLPDLASPLHLDGALDYRGKRVSVALDVEKPAALLSGKPSHGNLDIKTEDFSAKVDGALATSGTMLKGTLNADISSLPKFVAWAQGGGVEQKLPFSKVSFSSAAEASAERLELKGAALTLDEVEAKGDVTLGFSGKPDIRARLAVNKLNLDRFTGTVDDNGAAGVAGAYASKVPEAQGWDSTPIDFGALKKFDADLALDTQGFSLKGAEVGPSRLVVTVKDGVLNFSSSEAALFEGKFSSKLTLNAANATPSMAFDFGMKGVAAKPVLATFADFDKLSGTAEADVSVTSSGNSQKTIVGNLDGKGAVMFRNGALEGIDLVNIAKMIQNRLTDMNVGAGKTEFVEMGGTFTVANGVANNKDLKLRGPLVQATGSGDIDLPRKYIQYRVVPVLTASSGAENAKGISVPVDVSGPFSDIRIRPDYGSVIKNALENPDEIKGTVKSIKDSVKPALNDLKDFKKDPAKALQGLLGGGLLGGQPAAEPEPAPAP